MKTLADTWDRRVEIMAGETLPLGTAVSLIFRSPVQLILVSTGKHLIVHGILAEAVLVGQTVEPNIIVTEIGLNVQVEGGARRAKDLLT